MPAHYKRIVIWAALGIVILTGLLLAFRPRALVVDLATVSEGPMAVTVDAEGETRVHDVFVLSAPVTGRLRRIDLHVGDTVTANETVLAQIEPGDPEFLDPRSESEARAALQAAESGLTLARAEVERAKAELEFADEEHRRARELFSERTITKREADNAERAYKTAVATLATTQAALQMREFERERARAHLLSPTETQSRTADCACITLTAPVSGAVLRVVNQSARVVRAAEPLVEVGDPADLEIVADYLSTDAVKIEHGQEVRISDWGADYALKGVVRRVEPFGFTKVSALGIEEQRVNVIVDLTSPREDWARLGHGYQVETQVVLWRSDRALTVPLTALFRDGNRWAVFVNDGGRARLTHVEVGKRNGLAAQIAGGLEPGAAVVLHPSDRVADDVRIRGRS